MSGLLQAVHFVFSNTPARFRRALRRCIPSFFFREQHAANNALKALRRGAYLGRRRKKLSTRYSLVVPCHNVERYLDDFFHSLFSQSVDPACLEIIMVDDGSTDRTARRIADWQSRFPERIRYVSQHNQRQAAARNTGLAYATGDWVSFPDPDDFFSTNYVEAVDQEIGTVHSRPLSMISCNLVYFKEPKSGKETFIRCVTGSKKTAQFCRPTTCRTTCSFPPPQLGFAATSLSGTAFDSIRVSFPTFEDSHFVNRFLLLNPGTEAVFLKTPTYYYRKRADRTSTLDGAKLKPAWCLDALRYGFLDLLNEAQRIVGRCSLLHPENRSLRHPVSLRVPGRPPRASSAAEFSGAEGIF